MRLHASGLFLRVCTSCYADCDELVIDSRAPTLTIRVLDPQALRASSRNMEELRHTQAVVHNNRVQSAGAAVGKTPANRFLHVEAADQAHGKSSKRLCFCLSCF